MNDSSNDAPIDPPNDPACQMSIEEVLNASLHHARQCIRSRYQACESRIRESPATAVLGSAAAGYLLNRLPVRAILVTQVRILSALVPPALILFGAAKMYDFLQRRELTSQK